jgi:hypothetical protein
MNERISPALDLTSWMDMSTGRWSSAPIPAAPWTSRFLPVSESDRPLSGRLAMRVWLWALAAGGLLSALACLMAIAASQTLSSGVGICLALVCWIGSALLSAAGAGAATVAVVTGPRRGWAATAAIAALALAAVEFVAPVWVALFSTPWQM